MQQIKKIGLVIRPDGARNAEINRVREIIKEKGFETAREGESGIEAIVTIGGDGTFLGAARRNLDSGIPVLGIHLGRMGFLAEADFRETEEMFDLLAKGEYVIKERMVMEVETGKKVTVAVNELVIRGNSLTSFVNLKLFIEKKYVNSYLGDGLIVATPTGSTAYNLSAGGPIVYPFSEDFILTPIASHALSQRSLVLPAKNPEIEIRFNNPKMVAIFDGQEEQKLEGEGRLIVRKRNKGLKCIFRSDSDFFGVLKEKLKWGDDRE